MAEYESIEKIIKDMRGDLFRLSSRVQYLEDFISYDLHLMQKTLDKSIQSNEISILKLDNRITSDLEFLEDEFKGRLDIVGSEIGRVLEEEVTPLRIKIEKISSSNIIENDVDV